MRIKKHLGADEMQTQTIMHPNAPGIRRGMALTDAHRKTIDNAGRRAPGFPTLLPQYVPSWETSVVRYKACRHRVRRGACSPRDGAQPHRRAAMKPLQRRNDTMRISCNNVMGRCATAMAPGSSGAHQHHAVFHASIFKRVGVVPATPTANRQSATMLPR